MPKIELSCSCGAVQGITKSVDADLGTRIACCCDDCQRFAEHLDNADTVLDEYGGTDIFQMPISYVTISQGKQHIACVRLSSKGLHRWYAKCCNTPIGNTLGPGGAFIGLIHSFMHNAGTRDRDLGISRGYIQTKFATKDVPSEQIASPLGTILRSLLKLLVWKIEGFSKPSSFFTESGEPITQPTILKS